MFLSRLEVTIMEKLPTIYSVAFLLLLTVFTTKAQRGYYDAPYLRYEADSAALINASVTSSSFAQTDLQSEASDQVCVDLTMVGASVEWEVKKAANGLVLRYSVPDKESAVINVYVDDVLVDTLSLTSYYSWEYLWSNGNPNNTGVKNQNPRMRFDEVRLILTNKVAAGGKIRLENKAGNPHIDFIELEEMEEEVLSAPADVTYTGDGSDLQDFIDRNGGKTIYLPKGKYEVDREIYFGVNGTSLKGAGMWYTQIHFTNEAARRGGLRANAEAISFSGLYLTTVRNSRSDSYKAINGVYTTGSTIKNIWAEHFEVGAWIAQFNQGSIKFADGFTLSYCRFRNNYADGINLSKGTSNAIVEHCSFRNNGDDDMAIWPANGMSCDNNTFRYSTSENCWRAAGCAFYGGTNNKAQHLIIKDNLEVGIKINNSFDGAGFSESGMHEFSDITIIKGGTFNDLFNNPVGAIDLASYNNAGTRVNNIKFSNIDIIDSKNDAIYMHKANGEGFYNLVFENITINGTGLEYPNNNVKNLDWGRGYGVLFVGRPTGYGSYCNMNYSNRGGNASVNINNAQQGVFDWQNAGCGTEVTSPSNGAEFGECGENIIITGTASEEQGTIDSLEFYIDNVKVGVDASAPYSFEWADFTFGNHKLYVRSIHSTGAKLKSAVKEISVVYFKGLIKTDIVPTIDGEIDPLWLQYTPATLHNVTAGNIRNKEDLSASFRVTYDATNLYVLVDVIDDSLVNDGGATWQNDALELFIDIGNDKKSGYEANDFAYTFQVNDTVAYEANNKTKGVVFTQLNTQKGYVMEISLPWSTLGAIPGTGAFIGFDVHINDDDNGGNRDAKIAWNDCDDDAFRNPGTFGTLQESGCTSPTVERGFIAIDAELSASKPLITWSTYLHESNLKFEVQRDEDGSGTFDIIYTTAATGNVGASVTKDYIDKEYLDGSILYRVAKVAQEGCKIISDNVSVTVIGLTDVVVDNAMSFYPNPFHGSGSIGNVIDSKSIYSVTIKDLNGKVIEQTQVGGDSNKIGENLMPGMYLLEVFDGNTMQSVKIVKQ